MSKRLITIVSGGIAGLVVLAACMLLVQSGEYRRAPNPVQLQSVAMPEMPPPPPAASSSRSLASAPRLMVSAPSSSAEPGRETTASADPIEVSVPQLAYAYVLGYRVPGPRIAEAQQAHLALCQQLGAGRCQLVSMRHGSSDSGYGNANLQLRVASSIAQAFRADLTKAVSASGGRPAETSITAEDVSKDMVDTEARIRQREVLVSRLTEMLRNRQGRVSELVEAERSVAAAQEELDQAKGWLRQLRTRVALSQFTINYVPTVAVEPSPRAPAGRVGDAIVVSAGILFAVGRNLLIVLIFLTPWAAIGLAGFVIVRRWHKRRPAVPTQA